MFDSDDFDILFQWRKGDFGLECRVLPINTLLSNHDAKNVDLSFRAAVMSESEAIGLCSIIKHSLQKFILPNMWFDGRIKFQDKLKNILIFLVYPRISEYEKRKYRIAIGYDGVDCLTYPHKLSYRLIEKHGMKVNTEESQIEMNFDSMIMIVNNTLI